MLSPLVLDPTPPEWVNDDPADHPLDPGRSHDDALRHTRWWGAMPDTVTHAAGRAARLTYVPYTADPSLVQRDLWLEAWVEAGHDSRVFAGEEHYRYLLKYGVDPTVLLALRGTGLRHADRLAVACSGMTPAEAHQAALSGTLDVAGVRALIALRRRH